MYLQIVKEKLQLWLNSVRSNILKMSKLSGFSLSYAEIQKAARLSGGLETSLEMFLATGKLKKKQYFRYRCSKKKEVGRFYKFACQSSIVHSQC